MKPAALMLFALVAVMGEARAETVVSAGGGALYVDKQAATPVTGLSGALELSAGIRFHPRSTVRARIFGFRADGTNLIIALAGDFDLVGQVVGVSTSVGFSRGAESKSGNFAALGLYARAPLGAFALRLDAAGNMVVRNDFSGIGVSSVLSVELTWR